MAARECVAGGVAGLCGRALAAVRGAHEWRTGSGRRGYRGWRAEQHEECGGHAMGNSGVGHKDDASEQDEERRHIRWPDAVKQANRTQEQSKPNSS